MLAFQSFFFFLNLSSLWSFPFGPPFLVCLEGDGWRGLVKWFHMAVLEIRYAAVYRMLLSSLSRDTLPNHLEEKPHKHSINVSAEWLIYSSVTEQFGLFIQVPAGWFQCRWIRSAPQISRYAVRTEQWTTHGHMIWSSRFTQSKNIYSTSHRFNAQCMITSHLHWVRQVKRAIKKLL